ncbi:hypothetical protein EMA8858_03305 [Emticicia aquatica]|jgi:hypothetical protein|uniref:Cytochrome C Planctomycete-type domain-containing protein n=1 Tax=Emticicia aquatica TaxID=1681835 RepID=A0ABN8EWX0_9BACT|nr:hypothetical protein [Emticicia aquatica]CAH0997168.1 hypothetical protein EMA8858_03305 [Emticicia aquatica]
MFHKRAVQRVILMYGSILFLASCYKDRTVIAEVPEITRTVSFSQDITPIFNNSCSMSGCHNAGGQVPNLSTTNAFNSLIVGNYIDKNNATNSILYLKMTGKRGIPMPVSGVNKDYNALIYAWIKQGASNN